MKTLIYSCLDNEVLLKNLLFLLLMVLLTMRSTFSRNALGSVSYLFFRKTGLVESSGGCSFSYHNYYERFTAHNAEHFL